MTNGRTKNALRNTVTGVIERVIMLIFPFLIRTIMIYQLGAEYLGLGSLFASILQVLSMAELGFSSAITFSLYKPIAENDTATVCALMALYKKIYRIIGTVILVVGLALTPLLERLINGTYPSDINLTSLFFLYLFNTVISYFLLAYRSCLLTAHQRSDVINKIHTVMLLIQYGLQMLMLMVTHNYYAYFTMTIICTILNNVSAGIMAKKRYPQYHCDGELSKEQRKEIVQRINGLVIQKVSAVSRNSFDNIFVSTFLGLTASAIYSNYYYIMSAVYGIVSVMIPSLTASVGNSLVIETQAKNYRDFTNISFTYLWIAGWFSICMAVLYQPFMMLWVGTELMLPSSTMILFCVYFYQNLFGDIFSLYIQASGLWWKAKTLYAMNAAANLILNYILVRWLGMFGILLATIITSFTMGGISLGSLLFKEYFSEYSYKQYLLKQLQHIILVIVAGGITWMIVQLIPKTTNVLQLLLSAMLCVLIPNAVFAVAYCKTVEFSSVVHKVRSIIRR